MADVMALLFSCFLGRERRSSGDSTAGSGDFSSSSTRDDRLQSEIVYVELLKQDNEPLGLKLEGGTDYDQPVCVSHLHPGGVAYMSGALQIGDRVLSINGTVTERLTHSEVIALLENSGNIVNLEIAYDTVNNGVAKLDDEMGLKTAFIAISCEDNSIFPGFVISGGRLENRSITVSHVKQGSFPYRRGILRAGDRILQINHIDMRNASRSEADQLLVPSENGCTLQIEYDVPIHNGLEAASGPIIFELQKPHGASLGISLSDDRVPGEPIMISRIREAGIADRSGVLHYGDRLLSINGIQLYDKSVHEARHLLSHSGINVKLEIMLAHHYSERPGISPSFEDGNSDVSSRTSLPPLPSSLPPLPSTAIENGGPAVKRQSQLSLTSVGTTVLQSVQTHPEVMTIELTADPIGFGMEIEGGTEDYCSFPVTISNIIPGGPTALLGRLMVGDRILSINSESLCDVSLDHASKLIKESDDTLQMEVEFDVTDAMVMPTSGTFEVSLVKTGFLNLGLSIRKSGDTVWISDLKKGGIAHRSGSLQAGDILLVVNGVSVINATPQKAAALLTDNTLDTISLTVKREMTNNFMPVKAKPSPVIYSVELNSNGETLGISLDGSESPGQPIVISEIREGGVAHRTGAIKVGDRIIAINGESLFDKTVQDACRILQLSGGNTVTLKISKGVIRRRPRPRMATGLGNKYQRQRYNYRFKGSRGPSRISQTSESEMSTSFTSLEGSTHYLHRYSKQGRGQPNHTHSNTHLPGGRYSPTRRHGSAGGRGRTSPSKERTSPNRDRGVVKGGVVDPVRRLSLTETTDEEYREEERWPRKNISNKSPLVESRTEPRPIQQLTTFEENILETIHRSEGFTKKLRTLAAQSGSEESDQEMLPPGLLRDYQLPHSVNVYGGKLFDVHIVKDKGFGFSLSDGLDTRGVFINQIDPKGPAAQTGLQPFDQIIKVDDILVKDYDCHQVRPLFMQADAVLLTVSRRTAETTPLPIPPNLQVYSSSIVTDEDTYSN